MVAYPASHGGWLHLQPLPSLAVGGGADTPSSNKGLVFLMTSAHREITQGLAKSDLIRTKDTPITQEIPRV